MRDARTLQIIFDLPGSPTTVFENLVALDDATIAAVNVDDMKTFVFKQPGATIEVLEP